MKRMNAREARAVLTAELNRAGWETCSALTITEGARTEAKRLEWWHENTPANETSETARSIAYLRAYFRIGGPRLYAGGLFLDRRRLWMDRSVISRLERDGYLAFEGADTAEPYFTLTSTGERLVGDG